MPAAIQALLDDAVVDIETWVSSEVDVVFAEQESAACASRRWRQQAERLPVLHGGRRYPAWSWGNLGYVATGTAGAFKAGIKPS